MRALTIFCYLFIVNFIFSQSKSQLSEEFKVDIENILVEIQKEAITSEKLTSASNIVSDAYKNLLTGAFLAAENSEESAKYLSFAELCAVKESDLFLLTNVYFQTGRIHYHKSENVDSTFFYFNQSLNLSIKTNNNKGIVQSYKYLAFQAMKDGDFIAALDYLLLTKPYVIKLNDLDEEGSLFNNIGHIYMRLGLPSEAITMFEQLYEISEKIGSRTGMIVSLLNQAEAYADLGDANSSFKTLDATDSLLMIPQSLGQV